jgi:hypothetical protein
MMNIESDVECLVIAKTCGYNDHQQRVTYSFVNSAHSLCVDNKDIILSEIEACERLLNYADTESEKWAVQKELSELRLTLDLLG